MKKILIITMLFAFYCTSIKAQLITHDPQQMAQGIRTTIETAKTAKALQEIKKAREKVESLMNTIEFIENFQSFQKIVMLVQSTSCTLKNFDFYYQWALQEGLFNENASCWFETSYSVNESMLNGAVDMLNLAIERNARIGQSDRADLLDKAIKRFKESNQGILELKNTAESLIHVDNSIKRTEHTSDREIVNILYAGYVNTKMVDLDKLKKSAE